LKLTLYQPFFQLLGFISSLLSLLKQVLRNGAGMPAFPSVFPLWWIGLTAAVVGLVSLVVLRRLFKELSWQEVLLLVLVTSLSVLAWRTSGNIKELNDDPVPPFSPNDWLCPAITFVSLSVYAAFRPGLQKDRNRWEKLRAILTFVSLMVNVLVI